MKVLLVDDDTDLLDVTAYALRREGFNVIVATDGVQALRRWQSDKPDLIVLDVGMPHLGGFEVCRKIRQASTTPIIMLTSFHDEEHVIQGFQLGVDDYVTKPFSPRQLAMRIRAIWRRGARAGEPEPAREMGVGALTLDTEAHQVHHGGQVVQLTPIEFRLLYILATNAGRVVSASRLVDYAWGYDGGDVSLLKTHFSHIRTKLGFPGSGLGEICAVPRVGYRFTAGAGPDGRAEVGALAAW
ncbi:MAG TPA: response regulator transcription factor [Thermomicrobiales bacterium]|nr:response regulator transcription factor [Thermomicrobiales bacterium]